MPRLDPAWCGRGAPGGRKSGRPDNGPGRRKGRRSREGTRSAAGRPGSTCSRIRATCSYRTQAEQPVLAEPLGQDPRRLDGYGLAVIVDMTKRAVDAQQMLEERIGIGIARGVELEH